MSSWATWNRYIGDCIQQQFMTYFLFISGIVASSVLCGICKYIWFLSIFLYYLQSNVPNLYCKILKIIDLWTLSSLYVCDLILDYTLQMSLSTKFWGFENNRSLSPVVYFQGIKVQVRSVYIEGRSQPLKGQYFFAYRIRITNNSNRPVQLLRRHWIITDANGKTENVWLVILVLIFLT